MRGASSGRVAVVNAYWDGKNGVVLVSRDSQGRRQRRRVAAEHVCYLRKSELKERTERDLRASRAIHGMREEDSWWRVRFKTRDLLRKASAKPRWPGPDGERLSYFERAHVEPFEADMHPVRRWLTDNEVEIQRPKRCYLDIEADSRVSFSRKEEARILSWAVVDDEGKKWSAVLEDDDDAAEHRLLMKLWRLLDQFDQVVAWYGDGYDFPMIRARSKLLGIQVQWQGWLWLDHLELFKKMNISASESGDEKQSYRLGAVSTAVLGETKADLDASRSWEYWAAGGAKRQELVDYNVRDTDLLRLLENATGYIELLQVLCQATTTFPDSRGMNGTNYVEGFLLKLARGRDLHFKTVWDYGGRIPFEGAYVLEPKKGILRDVHVCDFSSLYPSIIQTWNMSPETLGPRISGSLDGPGYRSDQKWHKPRPDGHCEHPTNGWTFTTKWMGLLAEAVTELKRLRKHWNDLKASLPPGTPEWKEADRRSSAYKIAANTFYGVIGSPFSRFFDRVVAESVAQGGVWLLKLVLAEAEHKGMSVVFGDTDSAFVAGSTEKQFKAFVDHLNTVVFPRELERLGCPRNDIKLAYEKQFDVLVMVTKKRYAGNFVHYKGSRATKDSKPEIKGLEFKRGDTARIARRMQEKVIHRLLTGDHEPQGYLEMVAEWRTSILEGEIEMSDVVLSKRLAKGLGEYKAKKKKDGTDAAQPPHVEVAKLLQQRGADVSEGTRIAYVVTDATSSPMRVAPADDVTIEDVDRHYIWENLAYPATKRVLEVCFPAYGKELKALGVSRPSARRPKPEPGSPLVNPRAKGVRRRKPPEGQGTLGGIM